MLNINHFVVEIKMLAKALKFLSVLLWGPLLTFHLCRFNPTHASEGDSHSLQEGLIHTTMNHLSLQTLPSPCFSPVRGHYTDWLLSSWGYTYLCLGGRCFIFPTIQQTPWIWGLWPFLFCFASQGGTFLMCNRCLINEWMFQWERDKFL